MPRLLSTDEVTNRERTAFWTDVVCDTYVQLECDLHGAPGSIKCELAVDRLATLELSRVTATAQTVRRTPAKIACASEDFLLVSIQTRGEGRVSQDGRQALLRPGDFALYDSTRPYTLGFDGPFQQYVLMLPGAALRSQLADTHRLTASAVNGQRGAGHLLIGMISTLAAEIGDLAPESSSAVADSVAQILIAGLSTLPSARRPTVSRRQVFHRERIRALAREHLRDPGFGVAELARRLCVSPSTLARAWAGEPCPLHEWIWAQRLDGARRDLLDPACAARSVSEIAFAWGFSDAAHFSRAFRTRFGRAPRECRHLR